VPALQSGLGYRCKGEEKCEPIQVCEECEATWTANAPFSAGISKFFDLCTYLKEKDLGSSWEDFEFQ
jgi:hypothetical protein